VSGNELGESGVEQLRQVLDGIQASGAEVDRFVIDISIARGLDYYTGTIYETILDELPSIGSVCSGGRYDNLAKLFSNQELPGVGASLGLDRMLAAMEKLGKLPQIQTPADVLIVQFDSQYLGKYLWLARELRAAGVGVEVFPDAKKLGVQFKYADRKGFRAVIIAGADELAKRIVQIKWLADGRQTVASVDDGVAGIVEQLWAVRPAG
jgi:histidyl-tRNA synthetase